MNSFPFGQFFPGDLQKVIKSKFFFVDDDPDIGKRLFFDNAGGSFRLKSTIDNFSLIDSIPDCPERAHKMALRLQEIQKRGIDDLRIIFNASSGSILTSLTASQVMFDMVGAVAENVPGTNMVTTILEHPSAFDAMQHYSEKTGRELRIARSNKHTGGVDPNEILKLIDQDTVLFSCMWASNISGAIFDMKEIVRRCREVKPDLYIICDAVQHAPHGVINVQRVPVDGINIAPYKFFGNRGSGIGWVSPRLAVLPHHRLLAKPAEDWELGSPAPAHFAMITAIVDYVTWLGSQYISSNDRRTLFVEGMTRIKLHERALMHAMLTGINGMKGLREIEGVTVYLDYEDLTKRDFILAIGFDNLDFTDAVREYERRHVIVYDRLVKSLYSKRMLESFDMRGAIRVSPLHCNDIGDMETFLQVTQEIAKL